VLSRKSLVTIEQVVWGGDSGQGDYESLKLVVLTESYARRRKVHRPTLAAEVRRHLPSAVTKVGWSAATSAGGWHLWIFTSRPLYPLFINIIYNSIDTVTCIVQREHTDAKLASRSPILVWLQDFSRPKSLTHNLFLSSSENMLNKQCLDIIPVTGSGALLNIYTRSLIFNFHTRPAIK
jgi:hypothetical protein